MPEVVLKVADVTKNFGGVHALRDINLDIEAGKTRAIIGPNGAGKSTLLRIVCGLARPDRGEVRVDGPFGGVP